MIAAVIVWFGLAGFYILLAGAVGVFELVAGIVCATSGTALAVGLSRIACRRFVGWPAPRAIWRPLGALAPETLAVGRQLVAAIFTNKAQWGAYLLQPFDPGGDDAVSRARRAVVVVGVSLAPGSFVIRGDRTDAMILHTLPPKESALSDPMWPV